ncbi:MAG: hypothetical protein V9E98_05530 [Candidatus Nanopelagicales bacterium]
MASTASAHRSDVIRRMTSGMVLLLVAVAPPLVVGALVLGSGSFTLCLFGVLVGLMNTLIGGVRVGLIASALFVLLTPVALTVGTAPVAGASLMAVICLFVGGGALWRRYSGLFEIPLGMIYLMTLPEPQTSAIAAKTGWLGFLVTAMLATGVSALWSVAAVRVLKADKDVPLSVKNAKEDTVAYTIIMTVLVSLSTLYVLAFAQDTHGVWLVLTLFMVLQIGPGATESRAFHRVWGTIAGAWRRRCPGHRGAERVDPGDPRRRSLLGDLGDDWPLTVLAVYVLLDQPDPARDNPDRSGRHLQSGTRRVHGRRCAAVAAGDRRLRTLLAPA